MSNTYEKNIAKVAKSATLPNPATQESHSTYEKIGTLDVSVYSNCDYPKKGETVSGKGDLGFSLRKKVVLLVVCGVAVATLLVLSLVLGIAGVAIGTGCCASTPTCRIEETSSAFTPPDTADTEYLLMDTEV